MTSRHRPHDSATAPHHPDPAEDRYATFRDAQRRVLDRHDVGAESRFVDVPLGGGSHLLKAHVLVAGEGPPLVLVIGGTIPAAFWAPLMAHLPGRTLYAMDLPGFGLTDPVDYRPETYNRTATEFLAGVLDAFRLDRSQFATHSMGTLWTHWLTLKEPTRVEAQVMIGCPALYLGAAAPLPMRLASIPGLGRLLLSQRPSAKQVERVLAMVGENPHGIDEVRDLLVACERLPAYVPSMLGMMRSAMSWTRVRPAVATGHEQLRTVRHPVQLIWGEDDTFGSLATGRRVAELIPGGMFETVPGGHAPWLHHPETVGALVTEFLGAQEGASDRSTR